jgi:hypothetical protein
VLAVVEALSGAGLEGQLAEAVGLLALVAGQDVEPAEGSDGTDGRWRIARKVAEDRVVSVADPDARQVHTTVHHSHDGDKGHVVVETDTGLFTAARLTKASGLDNHEAMVGCALLAAVPGLPDDVEVLGDTAYGTGDARATLADAGHIAVIKPMPLRPTVAGGFTLDDFQVDESSGMVTCPNGMSRPMSANRNVTFGVACRGCGLRARCTTSASGRGLAVHPRDALLRPARRDWASNEDLRAVCHQHRPMVERSISWLIGPKGRCRRLRYRGVTANDA